MISYKLISHKIVSHWPLIRDKLDSKREEHESEQDKYESDVNGRLDPWFSFACWYFPLVHSYYCPARSHTDLRASGTVIGASEREIVAWMAGSVLESCLHICKLIFPSRSLLLLSRSFSYWLETEQERKVDNVNLIFSSIKMMALLRWSLRVSPASS